MRTDRFMLCGLVGGALVTVAGMATSGEVSSEVQALRVESAQNVLQGRVVPVLRRVAGPGNQAALDRALDVLRDSGLSGGIAPPNPVVEGGSVFVKTEGWVLHVTGEGRRVRFRLSGPDDLHVSGTERLPYAEVMRLGKLALENELSSLVPLASNERLVPLAREDGKMAWSTPDGAFKQEVFESLAHYGRSVGGVNVVGQGSRAVVTFSNDGRLTGFDLDWSEYASSETDQETVSVDEMNARLAGLEERGALAVDRQLRHVECGYYDGGTGDNTTTSLIQPGCLYQFSLVKNGQPSGLLPVAIPAGRAFASERGWLESVVLASGT